MTKKSPEQPLDAPAGTTWYGGPIEWFSVSLRLYGDDLIPGSISELLDISPNTSTTKGELVRDKTGNQSRLSRIGSWIISLEKEDTDQRTCDTAIKELLNRVNHDEGIWNLITERFSVDLPIGLVLQSNNKGLQLEAKTLKIISSMNIPVGFDIYYEEMKNA